MVPASLGSGGGLGLLVNARSPGILCKFPAKSPKGRPTLSLKLLTLVKTARPQFFVSAPGEMSSSLEFGELGFMILALQAPRKQGRRQDLGAVAYLGEIMARRLEGAETGTGKEDKEPRMPYCPMSKHGPAGAPLRSLVDPPPGCWRGGTMVHSPLVEGHLGIV